MNCGMYDLPLYWQVKIESFVNAFLLLRESRHARAGVFVECEANFPNYAWMEF